MISLEDIFAVSVREVGLVYFALLAPLALRTDLFNWLDRARAGRMARLMDGPGAKQPFKLLAIPAFLVAVPLAFLGGDLSSAFNPARVKTLALVALIAVLVCEYAAVWLSRRARFSSGEVIALGAILLAFGCLVFGVYKGSRDHLRTYRETHNFLECRTESSTGGLLIRRVGGSDLLLTEKGYVLAKDRCILYLDERHRQYKSARPVIDGVLAGSPATR